MNKSIKEGLLIFGVVIALIGLRFLFCFAGVGVYYLLKPHLGLMPSAVLGFLFTGFLITVTGTWQHQIEREDGRVNRGGGSEINGQAQ